MKILMRILGFAKTESGRVRSWPSNGNPGRLVERPRFHVNFPFGGGVVRNQSSAFFGFVERPLKRARGAPYPAGSAFKFGAEALATLVQQFRRPCENWRD